MGLTLVPENNDVLREVASPWDFTTDGDPTDLVKEMTKVMFLHGGIGLAAPQCGITKRIFVLGTPESVIAYINPEIISGEERIREQEGCLSFPGIWLYVERYKSIKVRYQTLTGEIKEQELTELKARAFQHELDHLNGICFDVRVGKLALARAKEKRKKSKGV